MLSEGLHWVLRGWFEPDHFYNIYWSYKYWWVGSGGGQVVRMPAFYSDDLSSNPADTYSFSVKFMLEKNENKQKEAGISPFFKYCWEHSTF